MNKNKYLLFAIATLVIIPQLLAGVGSIFVLMEVGGSKNFVAHQNSIYICAFLATFILSILASRIAKLNLLKLFLLGMFTLILFYSLLFLISKVNQRYDTTIINTDKQFIESSAKLLPPNTTIKSYEFYIGNTKSSNHLKSKINMDINTKFSLDTIKSSLQFILQTSSGNDIFPPQKIQGNFSLLPGCNLYNRNIYIDSYKNIPRIYNPGKVTLVIEWEFSGSKSDCSRDVLKKLHGGIVKITDNKQNILSTTQILNLREEKIE